MISTLMLTATAAIRSEAKLDVENKAEAWQSASEEVKEIQDYCHIQPLMPMFGTVPSFCTFYFCFRRHYISFHLIIAVE